jgi:hypothetical protein
MLVIWVGKLCRLVDLVAGFSPRRSGFAPGSVDVKFVMDKIALGQVRLQVFRFYSINFIPLWFSVLIHHLEINNRPVGGRSSETSSSHRREKHFVVRRIQI